MSEREDMAKLRALAGELGYVVVRAIPSGTWQLIHEDTGKPLVGDRGTSAFSAKNAIKALQKLRATK